MTALQGDLTTFINAAVDLITKCGYVFAAGMVAWLAIKLMSAGSQSHRRAEVIEGLMFVAAGVVLLTICRVFSDQIATYFSNLGGTPPSSFLPGAWRGLL